MQIDMQRDEMPRAREWRNKTEHKLTKGKIKQCPPCAFLPSLFMAFLCNFPLKSPSCPLLLPVLSLLLDFLFPPKRKKTSLFPLCLAPSCCPKFSNALSPPKVLFLLPQIFLSQLLSWDPLSAFSPFFLSFSFFYLPQQATTDSTIAPLSKYGTSDHQHGRPS